MKTPLRPLIAALTLASVACGPAHALMVGASPDTPTAHVDANTPASAWSSAVAVRVNGSPYSGVVVTPRHVLTAAHVVGGALPSALQVQVNTQATPLLINASAVVRFPSSSFPYDDLALITLDTPVPAEVAIIPVHRQSLTASLDITLVGYGASGAGNVGPSVGSAADVKRSGRNTIDAVRTTLDSSGRSSLFFLCDFDGPTGTGAFGGPTLGNTQEVGLASGDSGSPVYAEIAGQRRLVGISTLVSPAPGSSVVDYRFGTVCGGMLLSDPRFITWLTAQTEGTLPDPDALSADVPLPLWAGAALLGLLASALGVGRRAAQT